MPLLLAPRHWGAHLLMVVAVAAAIALGVWQYDAWGARRDAEARDLTDAAPVALATVMTGDSVLTGDDLGRPVTLTGSWMPQSTLFVSDRFEGQRRGYWVVTPVLVGTGAGRSAMPVVRGWSATPQAPAPQGTAEVTGWLQASEGSGAPDPDPHDDVIPEMRIASVVEKVDADLYSAFVVSRTPTPGLDAVRPESIPDVSGLTALRNLLYAFQWWIFAGFALFIWWRWCRDQLEAAAEVTDPTPASSPVGPEQQVASDA